MHPTLRILLLFGYAYGVGGNDCRDFVSADFDCDDFL